MFSLKSPSKTMLESVCFQMRSWAINCSKKYPTCWTQITPSLKILLMLFPHSGPRRNRWIWTWRLVGHNDPSCFIFRPDFHPAPTPKFVRINAGFGNLRGESPDSHHSASAMLISLHTFVNITRNHAPIFHAHPYEIPELLFIRGLAPIRLGFASC